MKTNEPRQRRFRKREESSRKKQSNTRTLSTHGIKYFIGHNTSHHHWSEVAATVVGESRQKDRKNEADNSKQKNEFQKSKSKCWQNPNFCLLLRNFVQLVMETRSEGPEVLKPQGPKVQRSQGPKVPRSKGPKVPRSKSPKVPRSQGPKVQSSKGRKVGRSEGPKFQRAPGRKVFVDLWTYWFFMWGLMHFHTCFCLFYTIQLV